MSTVCLGFNVSMFRDTVFSITLAGMDVGPCILLFGLWTLLTLMKFPFDQKKMHFRL